MVEREYYYGLPATRIPSKVDSGETILLAVGHRVKYLVNSHASIGFYKDADGVWLDDIHSDQSGQGKQIARELRLELGSGKNVSACIIEEETLKKLKEFGYSDRVWDGEEICEITNKEELSQLKIVRVLQGAGFVTDKIIVSRGDSRTEPDMVEMNVMYYGHT